MMTATKRGKYGTLTVTYEAHGVTALTALDAMKEHRDALLETAKPLTEIIEVGEGEAMLTTTRLATEYRLALTFARASIVGLTEGETRDILLRRIDQIADLLVKGFAPLVEVPLSEAQRELEAERDAAGITGLLDDTEPMLSAERDNRPTEAA